MFGIKRKRDKEQALKPKKTLPDYKLLSPIVAPEEYKSEVSLLYSCLSSSSVFNVGIVGPYGSGKSSIIQTFLWDLDQKKCEFSGSLANDSKGKRKIQKKKIARVSLASFIENGRFEAKQKIKNESRISPEKKERDNRGL
jgi:hypothetical protein